MCVSVCVGRADRLGMRVSNSEGVPEGTRKLEKNMLQLHVKSNLAVIMIKLG